MKHLLTFAAGVFVGGVVVFGLAVYWAWKPPPTPALRPPSAIKVTLHPCEQENLAGGETVDIPPEKLDYVFRLLTPEKHYGHTIYETATPIVAHAVIRHDDGTGTFVLVRSGGVNPAVVAVDGQNFFYARNDPDVFDGATQLVALVLDIARRKKAERPPTP